jgi:hypothetical protein
MRSRVVSLRDIHEKYGAELKEFHPAFVIARRYPGWEESAILRPQGPIFRPVFPGNPDKSRPVAVEVSATRLPARRPGHG